MQKREEEYRQEEVENKKAPKSGWEEEAEIENEMNSHVTNSSKEIGARPGPEDE